tara:strand:+ start:5059 stop:5178 length:120 start_codon:yes stop_codon:yes gene_type:complete
MNDSDVGYTFWDEMWNEEDKKVKVEPIKDIPPVANTELK